RSLSADLGLPVRFEGLRVKNFGQYEIERVTLLAEDGSAALLRAEEALLLVRPHARLVASRATVDLTDGRALGCWGRLLRSSARPGRLEMHFATVRVEGGPEALAGDDVALRGGLAFAPDRRQAFLHAIPEAGRRMTLLAQTGPHGLALRLSPKPLLLGAGRLTALTGWPEALLPPDLTGEITVTEDVQGCRSHLRGEGGLDLAELSRRLGLPECSGRVALTIDVERRGSLGSGSVTVRLAEGRARVDALALEAFRYILFGQLSAAAVEEDAWTIDTLAFVMRFQGDRVAVESEREGQPILSARSERGYALELNAPGPSTTEEVARRARLALGR
ncbi:MAG: hypothetical protein KAX80_12025, partial [Planctomycetes bacterium]|nr:hypothetical protein [Planctomycetota bacterium]